MGRPRVLPILLLAVGPLACGGGGGGSASPGGRTRSGDPRLLRLSEVAPVPAGGSPWVELANPGERPVDPGGLAFVLDSEPGSFPIPRTEPALAPGEHRSFPLPLAPRAGRVRLRDRRGREIAAAAWPDARSPALRGRTFGRTSRGTWRLLPYPTPGAPNAEPAHAVLLNELCADNEEILENPHVPGSFDDWIEILNPADEDLDLGGFRLADALDPGGTWTFPPGSIIPAGGFLLVHADARAAELGGLHASFKLSAKGEEVGLFAPDGSLLDAYAYADMGEDLSHGRLRDGDGTWTAFRVPTPLAPNTEGEVDATDDPAHRKRTPDYDRVYDTSRVKRLDLEIDPRNWAAMRRELDRQMRLPIGERDFDYVECTVRFEGDIWEHVGVRFKGQSSLEVPYRAGREKLPLRLSFDAFEDTYPETDRQRFWGLKKLSLANGLRDPSLLRDLLCTELMRELGAPAPRAAPLEVWVDTGSGPAYWGLYTNVEQVDKRFLAARFEDDDGNLYKPEGEGADLTRFVRASFEKKTNEEEADWSDVKELIRVLRASYAAPEDLSEALAAVFDVDTFLPWLAVNSVLCNFDSYAARPHNYYLYRDPEDGRFRFIPWDHNQSFAVPIEPFSAGSAHEWDIFDPRRGRRPLIQRVLEVPEWKARYLDLVRDLLDGPLAKERIDGRIAELHELLRPHVVPPNGERFPHTLLDDPYDFDRNVHESVPGKGKMRSPGLVEFLDRRREFLRSVLP